MIEFLCPNGHKIRCQAAHAGRAAKCPRCGVKFLVPEVTEANQSPSPDLGESGAIPDFNDSRVGGPQPVPTTPPTPKEHDFEFLCPNGHRLHGPANLQGRPGQCPECGSRFRIPTYGDIPPEEEYIEQQISRGRADGGEGSEIGLATTPASATPDRSTAAETTAAMFVRLWNLRPKGATIETRLRSGEIIIPDQFLAKAANESGHAVFRIAETNSTFSLLIIPWEAIDRISLRGLSEVPKELAQ
jgi:DNA-directed RNA polymerase subunit RPC12/RpoP